MHILEWSRFGKDLAKLLAPSICLALTTAAPVAISVDCVLYKTDVWFPTITVEDM